MGSILCDPEFPVSVTNRFKAHIITFSLQRPIIKGQQVEFFYSGGSEPAVLPKLVAVLDKVTGEVKTKNPR
jgi:elongation factor 1 alpha-like protein